MAADKRELVRGTYYILDMGNTQYDECQICVFGQTRILIDAGHPMVRYRRGCR